MMNRRETTGGKRGYNTRGWILPRWMMMIIIIITATRSAQKPAWGLLMHNNGRILVGEFVFVGAGSTQQHNGSIWIDL